jgi:hypothetical protein
MRARPTCPAGPARQQVERGIEFSDRIPDELDAAVRALGQSIEDRGVEDECAMDALETAQRMIERSMVVIAQVAAKPDEGSVHSCRTRRSRWTGRCDWMPPPGSGSCSIPRVTA